MAVGVQLDFRGVTLAQYDSVIERLGYLPGGPAAPGVLCHWVAQTEEGIRVVDLWDSRQAFEKFLAEKIVPLFREIGVAHPPEAQVFEVHNYLGNRWTG